MRLHLRWIGFSDRRFAGAKDDDKQIAEGAFCQRVKEKAFHLASRAHDPFREPDNRDDHD